MASTFPYHTRSATSNNNTASLAMENLNMKRPGTPGIMPLSTHSRRQSLNELARSIDEKVTYPNRLLAQFDGAGTAPYPMNLARLVSKSFEPSSQGERLFNTALNNLPVFRTPDEDFQMSWDERYIYRNLGLHQFEYCHLVLGAALTECLPEDYAAMVMKILGDKHCSGDVVNISHRSWQAWIHSTNGLLSNTDFATLADDMMRLDPFRSTSGHIPNLTDTLVTPAVFAEAVDALGNLHASGIGELTLIGTNTLGWFAAFAELFLNVNVHISIRTGELLHTTQHTGRPILKLVFSDDIDHLDSSLKLARSGSSTINLITHTCDPAQARRALIPFTGRLRFESLLPKTFGQAFHLLAHQESKALVKSLGGSALLLELMAKDDKHFPGFITDENKRNNMAFGMGLIQTWCNWFPELRHLQGRLEKLQHGDLDYAIMKCRDGAQRLHELCHCYLCVQPPYNDADDPNNMPESFCLLALMETIINFGLAMSRIIVISKLFPSRGGILSLYHRQAQKLRNARSARKDGSFSRHKILFLDDWNASYSWRLQTVATIFSGSWPKNDLPPNLVAIHHEGICASMQGIHTGAFGTSQSGDSDVIQVSTGHINYKQISYVRASWGLPEGIDSTDCSWEEAKPTHLSNSLYLKAR